MRKQVREGSAARAAEPLSPKRMPLQSLAASGQGNGMRSPGAAIYAALAGSALDIPTKRKVPSRELSPVPAYTTGPAPRMLRWDKVGTGNSEKIGRSAQVVQMGRQLLLLTQPDGAATSCVHVYDLDLGFWTAPFDIPVAAQAAM